MDNLTLDNVSFGQELETTFDGNDFEARAIRNSRRRGSKAITAGKRRVKRNQRNLKKAQTALRKLQRRIR